MSTSVTETAEYSHASLPTRAQDGDTIYMDGGSAPLWPIIQRAYNRTAHFNLLLVNHLVWNGDFSVDAGGTSSSFTVRIGAIHAMAADGASSEIFLNYAGGTIGASKISGGGNLANSTWYYVYAYSNAGSIDFQITTTAPDATRRYKSGSGGSYYNYLGCFRTLSTGAPIPVRASRGKYVYQMSGGAEADLRVLDVGSSTATAPYATVDCSALVPLHSRLATLYAVAQNTAAQFNQAFVRTPSSTGTAEIAFYLPNINNAAAAMTFDIETDSSQDIAYYVTNHASAGAVDLTIYVTGFRE